MKSKLSGLPTFLKAKLIEASSVNELETALNEFLKTRALPRNVTLSDSIVERDQELYLPEVKKIQGTEQFTRVIQEQNKLTGNVTQTIIYSLLIFYS